MLNPIKTCTVQLFLLPLLSVKQIKQRKNMRKFDVTKFGESAAEQVENMNFTNAERQILDYAK